MQKTPMTLTGAAKLREELEHLKHEERPRLSKAIGEARELGDLKENAEYHAAREQQSFVEGRIQDIEGKLSSCQIVDVTKLSNEGKVVFGCTAHLFNHDTEESVSYQIVGEDESDLKLSKISHKSPIALAIIGKDEGATVEVDTPNGTVEYDITRVEYI